MTDPPRPPAGRHTGDYLSFRHHRSDTALVSSISQCVRDWRSLGAFQGILDAIHNSSVGCIRSSVVRGKFRKRRRRFLPPKIKRITNCEGTIRHTISPRARLDFSGIVYSLESQSSLPAPILVCKRKFALSFLSTSSLARMYSSSQQRCSVWDYHLRSDSLIASAEARTIVAVLRRPKRKIKRNRFYDGPALRQWRIL